MYSRPGSRVLTARGARREARGARAGSASRLTLGNGVIQASKPVLSCAAHLNAAGQRRIARFSQRRTAFSPPCTWVSLVVAVPASSSPCPFFVSACLASELLILVCLPMSA